MAQRTCPRCKKPIDIPQPPPPKVQCAHCSAYIRLRAMAMEGATKSNPDMSLSMHDFEGIRAPASLTNPFEQIDSGVEAGRPVIAPKPRRERSWLLVGLLAALLVALAALGGVAMYRYNSGKGDDDPNAALLAQIKKKQDPLDDGLDISKLNINESINRGVAYLKAELAKDEKLYHRSDMFPGNAHLGAAALAGLTLLECGVSPRDPAVQTALRLVRDGQGRIYATYTLSVSIMFLDRLYQADALTPEDRKLIGEFAERLLSAQHENGFWGYGKLPENGLPKAKGDQREASKVIQHRDYVNLSNSQFAALALWIAKHHDAKVVAALKQVAQKARERQKEDGTWWYDHGYTMAQTSTCAGLIFLAIERGLEDAVDDSRGPKPLRTGEKPLRTGENEKPPPKNTIKIKKPFMKDPAVEKGLAALGRWANSARPIGEEKRLFRQKASQNIREYYRLSEAGEEILPVVHWTMDYAFSGTIFGADSWGDLYLLWSIERVAVIYDLKKIGNRDWYAWGSEVIVSKQQGDGSWQDRFPGVPDTCFALLFLKRANLAKYLTDKLRELMMRAEITSNLPAPTPAKKE